MKRICTVIGSRANYASIKSALRAISSSASLDLCIVAGASSLLDRYGTAIDVVERDGFEISAKVHMLLEGETPVTMAKSTGLGLMELPTVFEQLKPDVVLTIGDRFETMATTLAAAYMNIPLAHTMGGEVSGTIDESIRHAITKFSHLHFAATDGARERIIKLGEPEDSVFKVGCPRIDLAKEILEDDAVVLDESIFAAGPGDTINLDEPFVIVSQHPVTTEYGLAESQMTETLKAVSDIGLPAIVMWPNADAGADDVARAIRKWREHGRARDMHFFKNLPVEIYLRLMKRTACLIGNSSSGIREGGFIGTPVVNVGTRQSGRERAENVIDAPVDSSAIGKAIADQISHGPYVRQTIYGDGNAGSRIAEILEGCEVNVQKRITY